jgi:spermidine synthase
MAATGFTAMALQIFLLLVFQSVYGYVYHQLAILIGAFMAGIAAGSWLGTSRMGRDRAFTSVGAVTQFLLAASAPALLYLLTALSRVSSARGALLAAQLAFPALAALCGMPAGCQFSAATRIYPGDAPAQKGLGVLYAVDLLGGCAGALLLSSYLIPVFGFWKTAWLTAAMNLTAAFLAARVSLEAKTTPA